MDALSCLVIPGGQGIETVCKYFILSITIRMMMIMMIILGDHDDDDDPTGWSRFYLRRFYLQPVLPTTGR